MDSIIDMQKKSTDFIICIDLHRAFLRHPNYFLFLIGLGNDSILPTLILGRGGEEKKS